MGLTLACKPDTPNDFAELSPPPGLVRNTVAAALPRALAAIGLLSGSPAWALGLGQIAGQAVIGDPVRLEIPLTGAIDRPIDNECVTIRRSGNPIDPEYFPNGLSVSVDRQATPPRVIVTRSNAVKQPILEFRVAVGCGYNLSHDYVVMVAPREPLEEPAATDAARAPALVVAPGKTSSSSYRVQASPVIASPRVGPMLPDGLQGKNIVLDKDLTLEQLSQRYFPGPLRQQRFMRWVAEANPELFAGAKHLRKHKLPAGAALVVPEGVPPRRPGDHKGSVNPLGEPIVRQPQGESNIASASAPAATKTPPTKSGATMVAEADRKDRLVIGGNSARSNKEAIAIVDQLTGMMEKQLAAQDAYSEKVKELEANVDTLSKQLKELESAAQAREAAWQAERQAEKDARAHEEENQWLTLIGAALAGGLVGGATLLGLGALFGRRKNRDAQDNVLADIPVEPVSSAAPASTASSLTGTPATGLGLNSHRIGTSTATRAAPSIPWDDKEEVQETTAGLLQPKPATTAGTPIEFELPDHGDDLSTDVGQGSYGDAATAAIELANIMTSMGLTESAAQTLIEHIRTNPRDSLPQWLKLLEIHRLNGNRTEFERSAAEMRQHFNVQPEEWICQMPQGRMSIEAFPHLKQQLISSWGTGECLPFLRSLLLDNREGTRTGFPLPVAEEILLLIAIQSDNG